MDSFCGRRRLLMLAIGAVVALSPGGMPARGATATVDIRSTFQPEQVTISVGSAVVWANRSNQSHTVTFEQDPPGDLHEGCNPATPALLRTGCLTPGSTEGHTFTSPGTYDYRCKLHSAMRGRVVVSAATSTTTTSTTMLPRQTTTSSTVRASTSSTTATTRPLATSSTIATSSTSTTMDSSSVLMPGDPPAFTGDDTNSSAAGRSAGSDEGSDTGTVALIVTLLLAVSAAGGYLLWRLRPGRT